MGKILSVFLLTASACASAPAAPLDKHPVSPLAWEVRVDRVGDWLFRYVRFLSESEYPCLRIETFDPAKNLNLVHRRDICKVRVNDATIDLQKDVSASSFENLKLEENVFRFAVDIVRKQPGSHYLACKVVISAKGRLSEPSCQEGERPPEQEQ